MRAARGKPVRTLPGNAKRRRSRTGGEGAGPCGRRASRSRIKVTVAGGSGWCFGVKRALRMAETALEHSRKPIYTLGELIHNPQVVRELETKGLRVARKVSDVAGGTLVLRCHGVSPSVVEEARKRGLRVVDATCPFVKKAQDISRFLSRQGYRVVILGDRGHPEVEAMSAGLPGVRVVRDEAEARRLKREKKLGVVAQTTQTFDTFSRVVCVLAGKAQELRSYNTICETTSSRQREALKLAGEVDVMVVVGGRNSANTGRLYRICKSRVGRTHWVEDASELKGPWFKNAVRAGVTGGASTPDWLVKQVAHCIASMEAPGARASAQAGLARKSPRIL
ncbi:MAG: 4-hydroxy-3-methylbut-2-enyl diphosphate reductase [Candidatus Eisenbacteria bacterium]|nr:4-hydroxy-3-methylbut-2-enyl diphosphate reductase [Candidatus Eisenbacteria bacterium]